jgi:hypothetical protein
MFARMTNYLKSKFCVKKTASIMTLEHFVEESLLQIIGGIENAQKK